MSRHRIVLLPSCLAHLSPETLGILYPEDDSHAHRHILATILRNGYMKYNVIGDSFQLVLVGCLYELTSQWLLGYIFK